MYEKFLNDDLSDVVREVFVKLMNASQMHLAAFQRQVNQEACGSGYGNCDGTGMGRQNGRGNNGAGGMGRGNRGTRQGSCIGN
jgi:hypothetical protein